MVQKKIFYKYFEINIKGQDIETYESFLGPLDNTKLHLSMHNDSVTPKKKRKTASDTEETPKDSE